MVVRGSWSGSDRPHRWAVLVHGGAGRLETTAGRAEGCRAAIEVAAAILAAGGSALDAVQAAVRILEDNPLFNAGTGACLTEDGTIELDAAIMEGSTLRAGAVCAMPPFRNPINVARSVLEAGKHVLYAGEGAADFARAAGFERLTSSDLTTDRARRQWEDLRKKGAAIPSPVSGGTVGAVARDLGGVLAAATSTGGIIGKKRGRVGDSPILGAGTYADDEAGAASATGEGEGMMRTCLSKTAVDELRRGVDPETSARRAVDHVAAKVGAYGGIILVDALGRLGWARSTPAMAWGAAFDGGDFAGGIE